MNITLNEFNQRLTCDSEVNELISAAIEGDTRNKIAAAVYHATTIYSKSFGAVSVSLVAMSSVFGATIWEEINDR